MAQWPSGQVSGVALSIVLVIGMEMPSAAEDVTLTEEDVVIKIEGSHRLLLPKDWLVEHKDGRIAPVAMEEYLSMKFGQVRQKFDETQERFEQLEQQVKALEEDRNKLQQRIRSLEERASAQP